jgi:hypothetical protein
MGSSPMDGTRIRKRNVNMKRWKRADEFKIRTRLLHPSSSIAACHVPACEWKKMMKRLQLSRWFDRVTINIAALKVWPNRQIVQPSATEFIWVWFIPWFKFWIYFSNLYGLPQAKFPYMPIASVPRSWPFCQPAREPHVMTSLSCVKRVELVYFWHEGQCNVGGVQSRITAVNMAVIRFVRLLTRDFMRRSFGGSRTMHSWAVNCRGSVSQIPPGDIGSGELLRNRCGHWRSSPRATCTVRLDSFIVAFGHSWIVTRRASPDAPHDNRLSSLIGLQPYAW